MPPSVSGRTPAELATLFGRGLAPLPAPDGVRRGALLALTRGFGGRLGGSLVEPWQPWLGKRFDASAGSGVNLIERSAFELVRLLSGRRYFRWWPHDEHAFEAFPFRVEVASSTLDDAQDVLRIDYDLRDNHPLLRRVLDEVVEVEAGVLLGQALLGRGGRRLRAAWFALW